MSHSFTTVLISRRFGRIITETPFHRGWVNAIKHVIPVMGRRWEGGVWSFDLMWYEAVKEITKHYFGDRITDTVGEVEAKAPPTWRFHWQTYLNQTTNANTGGGGDHFHSDDGGYYWSGAHEDVHDFFNDFWERRGGRSDQKQNGHHGGGHSDPYATLHVLESAPWEVVQASYRALSKMHHPDVGGDAATMQQINGAYDAIRRARQR